MNKKWVLLKESDSGPMGRGQRGKKKVYEILVDDRKLTCAWGMAEKTERQVYPEVFRNSGDAIIAAHKKLNSKLDKGYEIAYAV